MKTLELVHGIELVVVGAFHVWFWAYGGAEASLKAKPPSTED
jgi:hypothetical protein